MQNTAPTIRQIDIWPADIPLNDPFVISQGSMIIAETLYVRVMLEDGHHGYGEIAPFAALTGETRELSLAAAQRLIPQLIGQPIDRYRRLSLTMAAQEPQQWAARCGLETALLDACSRWLGIPLWALWGGEEVRTRQTDVTLPLLDAARTLALADHWRQHGFKTLKLKVGSDLGACRTKQFDPPGVVASSPKKSVVRRAQPCLGFRRENSSLTDRHATT